MCKELMPGEEENLSDEVIWEALPHLWIAISMIFLLAATLFMVLKLSGVIAALRWWDLFINLSIGEFFAFLVCTKWSNPMIHSHAQTIESILSSAAVGYLHWNSNGLLIHPDEDQNPRMCCFEDLGGHVMKLMIFGFQILLFMYLEGTPAKA